MYCRVLTQTIPLLQSSFKIFGTTSTLLNIVECSHLTIEPTNYGGQKLNKEFATYTCLNWCNQEVLGETEHCLYDWRPDNENSCPSLDKVSKAVNLCNSMDQ